MIISVKGKLAKQAIGNRFGKGFSPQLINRTKALLTALNAASVLDDLRLPPGNQLEALSGDRKGQYSLRINKQWRICFYWSKNGPYEVEIVDYH